MCLLADIDILLYVLFQIHWTHWKHGLGRVLLTFITSKLKLTNCFLYFNNCHHRKTILFYEFVFYRHLLKVRFYQIKKYMYIFITYMCLFTHKTQVKQITVSHYNNYKMILYSHYLFFQWRTSCVLC